MKINDYGIQQYQTDVDEWVKSIGVRYFNPMSNLAQLMEEAGEVARIINRTSGEQSFKKDDPIAQNPMLHLADELADVLFSLTCLANQHNINLAEALQRNLDKKTKRDKTRHAQNPKLKAIA